MTTPVIKTERLILRTWSDEDLEPFAKINADARVMEHFPNLYTTEESNQFAKRIMANMEQQGWGLWAVSLPGVCDFIGYIGLASVNFTIDFTPAIEIGWRLSYDFGNQGYATEGAKAVLKYGFENLGLNEIVSFTAVDNLRSQRVMEKIGMYHDEKGDFDHPRLPVGHRLRRHVLYRINKNGNQSLEVIAKQQFP